MSYVYTFLGWIMDFCYRVCGNYGLAIILFTFITKIVLLPLSMWTYFEGIKMVKIQPDINFIKARFYGQKDQIAEEQAKLFKEKHYSPMASVIPTIVQLFLLVGVVGVIKAGIENPAIDMSFGPINLGKVPAEEGIGLIWSPIIAGLAAWILCIAQNASNVLQAEQSNLNKHGMTIFSVALSLYLGWFVAVGTAFYWVWSNIFAVVQLYICNWIVKPRNYIDYERLEESRKELKELESVGNKKQRESFFSENKRRERADYKRFFSVVNKHLVFYSESNGFYKYFGAVIDYLLENSNLTIHYITSDPDDQIFKKAEENSKIRAYYIGENKLITLMMKMDADVVCMTMPDLENYHIKRSYVRDDVEYIFFPHGMGSNNLTMRRGCTDHFDTVFVAGKNQREEEEKIEVAFNLKKRNIVDFGYPLLDDMISKYNASEHKENARKTVLIAPSWQKDNIVDSCLGELLEQLAGSEYDVIVRPHPQEVRLKGELIKAISNKYASDNVHFQDDFSSNSTIYDADILITDWSDICWEFAFTTHKPVLFINTPMKIMNPEYKKIDTVPMNILFRDEIGVSLDTDKLDQTKDAIAGLLANSEEYSVKIDNLVKEYIYNLGTSPEAGGKYIIEAVKNHINNKKGDQQ